MQETASQPIIAIIGASGRSGAALCRSLLELGYKIIAIVRNQQKLDLNIAQRCYAIRQADLTNPPALTHALTGSSIVVNTAHARYIPQILAATTAPILALGSTRKFTRWPDQHGNGVLAGEAALQQDGRASLLLHPTMIYGAQGENNVQRLAALLKKIPFVPLPSGGRFLVQPIDQSDVTRSIVAGIQLLTSDKIQTPESVVIAGKNSVTYRNFIRLILQLSGIKHRLIFSVPSFLLITAAYIVRLVPGLPRIQASEIRRLTENKNFDIGPMQQRLGIEPVSLEQGLTHLLSPQRHRS